MISYFRSRMARMGELGLLNSGGTDFTGDGEILLQIIIWKQGTFVFLSSPRIKANVLI